MKSADSRISASAPVQVQGVFVGDSHAVDPVENRRAEGFGQRGHGVGPLGIGR